MKANPEKPSQKQAVPRNEKGQILPGHSGNPRGKPKGTRHKATQLALAMLDDQAEQLIQTCIELALDGDASLLRACLDKLVPPSRERPINVSLPTARSAAELPEVVRAVRARLAAGELLPAEAAALASLVEAERKVLETSVLATRLEILEQKIMEVGHEKS